MNSVGCPRCGVMNLPAHTVKNKRLNGQCGCMYCGMAYAEREDVVEKNLTEDEKHDIISEKVQDDTEKRS